MKEQKITIKKWDVFIAKDRRDKGRFPELIEIFIIEVKNKVIKIKWWNLRETSEAWMLWDDFFKQYELIEKIREVKNES